MSLVLLPLLWICLAASAKATIAVNRWLVAPGGLQSEYGYDFRPQLHVHLRLGMTKCARRFVATVGDVPVRCRRPGCSRLMNVTRFTSKERDAETGLDYFLARYYSGAQGRFTSPDEPFIDQDVNDPQSWNLYSYVRNNPLQFIDPTGQTCQKMSNGTTYDDMDGKGCAAVDEANKKKAPDSTVIGNPLAITWAQHFGIDRAYVKAVNQQIDIDIRAGNWDRVPIVKGEIPISAPGRFLFQSWYRATFPNRLQSLLYHWRKHGRAAGKTFEQYTREAAEFFVQNKSLATQVTLKDGTPGLLIRLGKGQPGGYFKPTGEVVTFWYK